MFSRRKGRLNRVPLVVAFRSFEDSWNRRGAGKPTGDPCCPGKKKKKQQEVNPCCPSKKWSLAELKEAGSAGKPTGDPCCPGKKKKQQEVNPCCPGKKWSLAAPARSGALLS
ncbi:hypothetical protein AAES_74990 [Amazona aestiva]|uniref:Uncharacterized protein n=1 Tax=Amazona aestiva TaxID=12930 RepID=A0A0Q3R9Q0_AMAAE|nr:hypothetical protein AAES_74990 [Amazona aestiva]